MRVAFISDIHSNLNALNAVLEDIDNKNIDEIYCLGDLLGYLNKPNEVVEVIRERKIKTIRGNNDEDIVFKNFKENKIKEWTYNNLKTENLLFVRRLPENKEIFIEGMRVILVHGSLQSSKEYLLEGEENTLLALELLEGDVLVAGHTHLPYIDMHDYKLMINSGSVGLPKNGSPNATYAILEIVEDNIEAEVVSVEYDVEKTIEELKEYEFPEEIIEKIRTGK